MSDTRYSASPDEFFKDAIRAAGLLSFRKAFGVDDSPVEAPIKSEFSKWDSEATGGLPALDDWIRGTKKEIGPITPVQRRAGFIEMLMHGTPKSDDLAMLMRGVMNGLFDECGRERHSHPFWLTPELSRRWHTLSLARRLPMLLVYSHRLFARIHAGAGVVFQQLTPERILQTLTGSVPLDERFTDRRIQWLWFDAVFCPFNSKTGMAEEAGLDVSTFRKIVGGATEPAWHTLGKCAEGASKKNTDTKVALIHAYLFARIIDSVWAKVLSVCDDNGRTSVRKIFSDAGIRVKELGDYLDDCEREHSDGAQLGEHAVQVMEFLIETEMETDRAFFAGRSADRSWSCNRMDWYAYALGWSLVSQSPEGTYIFGARLRALTTRTNPKVPMTETEIRDARAELDSLRAEFKELAQAQEHALLVIESRIALRLPGVDSGAWLNKVADLSLRALNALRTGLSCEDPSEVADEAAMVLGWMYRNGIKTLSDSDEGSSIQPILEKVLAFRDANASSGSTRGFNHEDAARRFELYARAWEGSLHPEIRNRLPRIPSNSLVESLSLTSHLHLVEGEIKSQPAVRKDRDKPIANPVIGRDNSPLMEEIKPSPGSKLERGSLAPMNRVQNLNQDPHLNFINTTGDTAMTYAISERRYDLAMEILRRVPHAITAETLTRKTLKGRCAIWYAISHGRRELLEEMLRPSDPGTGRASIPLSELRLSVDELTPLGFAKRQHFLAKLSYQEYGMLVPVPGPISLEVRRIREAAVQNPKYLQWLGRSAEEEGDKPLNPDGILDCISYLTNRV